MQGFNGPVVAQSLPYKRIRAIKTVWTLKEASSALEELLRAAEEKGEQVIEYSGRRFLVTAEKSEKGLTAQEFLRRGGPLGPDEELDEL